MQCIPPIYRKFSYWYINQPYANKTRSNVRRELLEAINAAGVLVPRDLVVLHT